MKSQHSKEVDILLTEISEKSFDFAQEGPIIIDFSKQGEPVLFDANEFILKTLSGMFEEKELVY